MANKEKGAKHLTELTLGIDGIKAALDEAQQLIEGKSIELGKTAAANIQKGMEAASGKTSSFEFKGFEKIQGQIKEVTSELGTLASTATTAIDGKVVQMAERYKTALGDTTDVIAKLKGDEIELTERTKTDYEKRRKAYQEEVDAAQAYYNSLSGLEERKRLSEKEGFDMVYRMTEREAKQKRELQKEYQKIHKEQRADYEKRQKEQADTARREQAEYNQRITQLDNMIRKQKEFTAVLETRKKTAKNTELLEASKRLTAAMEEERNAIVSVGVVTKKSSENINGMTSATKDLATEFRIAGDDAQGFFGQIFDKARWLSAFYIVDAVKRGLVESVKVIKETEDAAVQLQRVMNEDVSKTALGEQLYDISYEFGRDFADVQEVAVKFAQTGASWEDTIKLTKSAMLALNTAELDVQQSTEGLIAIMSQWNVKADDMQELIDEINITADKFPVTSEKIIAALQRASGSARQAKMSFEETVGAVTALSKATGRSGEAIGTALNSLLIYTSKPKALETFAEVGDESVKKAVAAYQTGAGKILDVWKALSKNLKNLSAEQQNVLYEGIGGDEFAQHLEEHAAVITDDIKKIYGTAGTFRQNYLVALLNDIDKIDEVTRGMTAAAGYSVAENEKYMDTLAARYEQFKSIWKSLAVQMGETQIGIMGGAKALLKFGSAVGVTIKHAGGLNAVLLATAAIVVRIRKQKVEKHLDNIKKRFEPLTDKVKLFNARLADARRNGESFIGTIKKMRAEMKGLEKSTGGAVAEITKFQLIAAGAMAAYGLMKSGVELVQEKQHKAREETLELSRSIIDRSKETQELYSQFTKASEGSEDFAKITYETAKALRIETRDADGAAKSVSQLAQEIREMKDASIGLSNAEWTSYIDALYEQLDKAGKKKGPFGFLVDDLKLTSGLFGQYGDELRMKAEALLGEFEQMGSFSSFFAPETAEDKVGFYEGAVALKQYMDELSDTIGLTEQQQEAYNALVAAIQKLAPAYTEAREAEVRFRVEQHMEIGEIPQTIEEFNVLVDAVMAAVGAKEHMRDVIEDMVKNALPELPVQLAATGDALLLTEDETKALEDSLKALNQAIDASQAAFDGARDAVEEYNKTGYLSIDTIQKITNGGYEFIKSLEFTEAGIRMTDDATADLINSQKQNVLESIKQAAAMDALQVVEEHVKGETDNVSTASENLEGSLSATKAQIAKTAAELLEMAGNANEAAIQMANLAHAAAPEKVDEAALAAELEGRLSVFQNYYNAVNAKTNDLAAYSKHEAKARENAQKSAFQSQKKAIEAEKNAVNERYKAEKEKLEAQKKAVKERYDAEINALKEVQKENSRLDKQQDYMRNKAEAQKDLAKAQTRSGVEYREQEAAAQQKVQDIESDWEKTQRDWSVEDRIKNLEKLRDAEIKNIDAQIKEREKLKNAEVKAIEQRLQALEAEKSAVQSAGSYRVGNARDTNKKIKASTKDELIKPTVDEAKKRSDEFLDTLEADMNKKLQGMRNMAELNATAIMDVYQKRFLGPFSASLYGLSMQMRQLNPTIPLSMQQFYTRAAQQQNYPIPYNPEYTQNYTRNAFVNATFVGESSSRGFSSGLWTKP